MYIVVLNVLYDDVYMYKSLQIKCVFCSICYANAFFICDIVYITVLYYTIYRVIGLQFIYRCETLFYDPITVHTVTSECLNSGHETVFELINYNSTCQTTLHTVLVYGN